MVQLARKQSMNVASLSHKPNLWISFKISYLQVVSYDLYTMDHPDLTVLNFMEKAIGL